MRDKKRILRYFRDKFWTWSRIGALLVPFERSHRGLQLSCFELCEIRHGLAKMCFFVNMGMRNLGKHLWEDDFHKATFKAFRYSSCSDLQKCMPLPNSEEYHEAKNKKIISLNETFPMVPRDPKSNFGIRSYHKNTIIFSFSLSFLLISL